MSKLKGKNAQRATSNRVPAFMQAGNLLTKLNDLRKLYGCAPYSMSDIRGFLSDEFGTTAERRTEGLQVWLTIYERFAPRFESSGWRLSGVERYWRSRRDLGYGSTAYQRFSEDLLANPENHGFLRVVTNEDGLQSKLPECTMECGATVHMRHGGSYHVTNCAAYMHPDIYLDKYCMLPLTQEVTTSEEPLPTTITGRISDPQPEMQNTPNPYIPDGTSVPLGDIPEEVSQALVDSELRWLAAGGAEWPPSVIETPVDANSSPVDVCIPQESVASPSAAMSTTTATITFSKALKHPDTDGSEFTYYEVRRGDMVIGYVRSWGHNKGRAAAWISCIRLEVLCGAVLGPVNHARTRDAAAKAL